MRKFVLLSLLLVGCSLNGDPSQQSQNINTGPVPDGCAKIEGSDIGVVGATLDVDGQTVTFTAWTAKEGDGGDFVGFTISPPSFYSVKSGLDIHTGSGTVFLNPNGTSGPTAKGISNVVLCECTENCEEEPTCETDPSLCPPTCETDPTLCPPEPFCGDGTVDEGEACDDGNTEDGDGCSANCTTETPDCEMGGDCLCPEDTESCGEGMVRICEEGHFPYANPTDMCMNIEFTNSYASGEYGYCGRCTNLVYCPADCGEASLGGSTVCTDAFNEVEGDDTVCRASDIPLGNGEYCGPCEPENQPTNEVLVSSPGKSGK